ncbi:uncharacterized protein LTHEOB_12460 [Lasiodiplodia theobromae]|uniref:uncharacterized protein n=1 Tax=Lasiodiplodia theobromae TaxID=45133 RepID=UPI0015C34F71|nr:uncharacterized protein LTHEOB_12460 [Lasiodiplodia theobromae]KAF4535857.1 hypothetical protein LTHEOB_12460 [Lasiodiplodia theobromae]
MAVFAVSSRFAVVPPPFTPADFAQRAETFGKSTKLSIDEIKASFLLCVHAMSNPLDWNAIAEVGRVMRMADLYDTLRPREFEFDGTGGDGQDGDASDCDAEEWKSVWWSIYSLDTCCTTLAVTSPASAAQSPPGRIELPSLSVSDFTESLRASTEAITGGLHPLPSTSCIKNWEIMSDTFTRYSCCNRNFYFGACHVMRAATELRSRIRLERNERVLQNLLQDFESECAAAVLALPSWVSNPVRNFAAGEAEKEHRSRLDTLLLFRCASMLVTVVNAQVSVRASSLPDSTGVAQTHWQRVMSKAGEVVQVVQNWRPEYFDCVDPMCSYIVYLTAGTLVIDCRIQRSGGVESVQSHSSGHLDLLTLFLDRVGRYWEVGRFLGDSLRDLKKSSLIPTTYEAAIELMSQFLHPMGTQALSGSRRADHNTHQSFVDNITLDNFELEALVGNTELDSDFLGALAPDGDFVSEWREDIML